MVSAFTVMRTLSALMASVAMLMLSNSVLSTLIALRGKAEGYSNTFIGLTMSAYFVGFCIGTFRSGTLINRVGHIRSFSAFAANDFLLFRKLPSESTSWLRPVGGTANV